MIYLRLLGGKSIGRNETSKLECPWFDESMGIKENSACAANLSSLDYLFYGDEA